MLKIRMLSLFLLLVLTIGCAGGGPDLVGSWQLVSTAGRSVDHETATVKSLTDTHFAFGHQTDDGLFGGGGTWSLEDGAYVETVQWHSLDFLVGHAITFDMKVEDGRWYHTADFVVDGERFHIEEVWERIEKNR